MPDKKFDLGDYVEVKDRIARFYDLYGQGRLVTSGYELTREPDDKPKVIVTGLAYRTPDDPHPGVGTSWMYLPGRTSYTLGSEIENAETSAWGRAIGSLGILIDRSIASANEIEAKADPAVAAEEVQRTEITGILSLGTSNQSDGRLRETPTGWMLGFNLTTGPRRWVRVLVRDDMALRLAHGDLELRPGMPLKVFGPIEKAEDHVGDRIVRYQRVTAEKIVADEWELPAETTGPVATPDAAGVPSAESTANPSTPRLFDEATEAELDGALR